MVKKFWTRVVTADFVDTEVKIDGSNKPLTEDNRVSAPKSRNTKRFYGHRDPFFKSHVLPNGQLLPRRAHGMSILKVKVAVTVIKNAFPYKLI
jgi:hypothetical protein